MIKLDRKILKNSVWKINKGLISNWSSGELIYTEKKEYLNKSLHNLLKEDKQRCLTLWKSVRRIELTLVINNSFMVIILNLYTSLDS